MESKSTGRYIRVAPRKARVVADLIRGMYVDEAQEQLRFCQKGASDVVSKVLGSAVANAVNNFGAKSESLYVKEAYVNQGPNLKRWRPRAMGRATRINKFTSHVTVIVAER